MFKRLLLLLLLITGYAQAQNGQIWRFGQSASVTFTGGIPSGQTGSAMYSDGGSMTQTDASGNLLFYSNGETVWNKNNQVMLNGTGLLGDQNAAQSCIAVPKPGSAGRFYLFTVSAAANLLSYSEIDMSLDGGNGGVIAASKNTILQTDITPRVSATLHCNGVNYWVAVQSSIAARMMAFQITAGGISPVVNSNLGSIPAGTANGYMKFSPNGKYLAYAQPTTGTNALVLMKFNNVSGQFSALKSLPVSGGEYGVSFSPNNSKLYVAASRDSTSPLVVNELYQFDLLSAVVSASRILISQTVDTLRSFGALQLGPDKKIYLVQRFKDRLQCITRPNLAGTNCQFRDSVVFLPNSTGRRGLPNFIDFPFGDSIQADFQAGTGCIGFPITFNDATIMDPVSWRWNFGDPSSGTADTSTAQNPTHTFNSAGTYQVTLIVNSGCFGLDTIRKPLVITSGISVNLGPNDTTICAGQTLTLRGPALSAIFVWYQGPPGNWLPNGIMTDSLQVTTAGWYRLTVNASGCTGEDSIQVFVNSTPPTVNLGQNQTLCPGNTTTLGPLPAGPSYVWNDGSQGNSLNVNASGQYWVTATQNNCVASDTVDIDILAQQTISLGPDQEFCPLYDTLNLTAQASGAYTSLLWNNGATSSSIQVLDSGQYSVRMVYGVGCIARDTVEVRGKCIFAVSIPTAFSPNEDGLNDVFRPFGSDITQFSMKVYDRFGIEVFSGTDAIAGWNGTSSDGKKLPEGFYSYVMNYVDPVNAKATTRSGSVFLNR